jgi:6-phosphogluconolactonase
MHHLLPILLLCCMSGVVPAADSATAASPTLLTWVSGYNPSIAAFHLDPATGILHPSATTPAIANASFLAWDGAHRHLYAVHEAYPGGKVSAFTIGADGALTLLDTVASGGSGPCHLCVQPNGKFLVVAHYGDGVVSVLPILADGSLGATAPAVTKETTGENAHEAVMDPSGKYLIVPFKGSDLIVTYRIDPDTGALRPGVMTGTGKKSGPRHLVFNAAGTFMYVINENDSTIDTYAFNADIGSIFLSASASTLAPGTDAAQAKKNSGAEIQLAPSGKFLYASNRGDDSIAIFKIGADGIPQAVGWEHAGGALKTPRHFSLTPDGSIMLVASQKSSTVTTLRVDPDTGLLTVLSSTAVPNGPAFVGVMAGP